MINCLSLMAARTVFTSFHPRSAAQSSMRGTQMLLIGAIRVFAVNSLTCVVPSLVSCRIYTTAAYAVVDASQKT